MATYIIAQQMKDGTVKHLEHYFTFEDAKEALMINQYAFYQTNRGLIADSLFIEKKEDEEKK